MAALSVVLARRGTSRFETAGGVVSVTRKAQVCQGGRRDGRATQQWLGARA